ncbi:MAG: preprotein translocase subunit SecA [Candidatus Hydrogenedentota bacterium]
MFDYLTSLFGTSSERKIKKLMPLMEEVRAYEDAHVAMTNDQLRAQTAKFKDALNQGATLDDILPEAFAAVCEAAKRVTGLRPFDVQILGAIVLHQGKIAEMVTGEGKTLVATMPLYLNALTGHGAHLVTVNDFLARRDREWMGPVFEFLGLTVGLVQHDMSTAERQAGYRADVTYGPNHEFGFDYLRDNMAIRPESRVQRELNYAIVDEIDSILIDEARTPLIISGRPEKSVDMYYKVDDVVRRLRRDTHYEIEEKGRNVLITEEGMEELERQLEIENLFTEHLGTVHMVENAIKVHNFFKKDDEYVVRNGEVLIVDEFTGRIMEGRRFSDGLHQALEAKERVPVNFETQTVASISYQNFFKLYNKLAGMTGTAITEGQEFDEIYGLDVMQVPTNLPLIREDKADLIFATEDGKFRWVVDKIIEIHETGRPVLVGTVSIEKSERLAEMLREHGVTDFQVLNAKYHEKEASIIANAGKRGAITIATNMAGRGTDIKLAEGVRELGGLAIIGTERHESRRIDNQLRGRAGRQGDPGTTEFFVSLEDEVARLFGGEKVKNLIDWFGSQQMDDQPLNQKTVSRSIERAQKQVEEHHFEMRKHLLKYDNVNNTQRQVIYAIRRDVLEDRDVTERIYNMFENVVGDAVAEYAPEDELPDNWDLEGLEARFHQFFGFRPRVIADETELQSQGGEGRGVHDDLYEQVVEEYKRREKLIAEEIRAHFAERYGERARNLDFEKLARRQVHDYELMVLLRTVDDKWIDHLYSMDYLRDSVRLRAYGQRDPLIEYKQEAYEIFEGMMRNIDETVTQTLFRITDPEVRKTRAQKRRRGTLTQQEDPMAQLQHYTYVAAPKQQDRSFASYDTSNFALAGQGASEAEGGTAPQQRETQEEAKTQTATKKKPEPVRVKERVKPNDPCPCGSGKKYKKCCGGKKD